MKNDLLCVSVNVCHLFSLIFLPLLLERFAAVSLLDSFGFLDSQIETKFLNRNINATNLSSTVNAEYTESLS